MERLPPKILGEISFVKLASHRWMRDAGNIMSPRAINDASWAMKCQ